MSGIWTGDNPLDFSLPIILFQMLLITFTTRAATFLLSPLRLPRYISEILVRTTTDIHPCIAIASMATRPTLTK